MASLLDGRLELSTDYVVLWIDFRAGVDCG